MNVTRLALLQFCLMLRFALPALAQTPSSQNPITDFDVRLQVKIPLRDGIRLNATLYLPKRSGSATADPTPIIVTLTPYLADTYHTRAAYFASHGYGFALVDVRGRGNSEGDFEPYVHDAHDGYDVVEW